MYERGEWRGGIRQTSLRPHPGHAALACTVRHVCPTMGGSKAHSFGIVLLNAQVRPVLLVVVARTSDRQRALCII